MVGTLCCSFRQTEPETRDLSFCWGWERFFGLLLLFENTYRYPVINLKFKWNGCISAFRLYFFDYIVTRTYSLWRHHRPSSFMFWRDLFMWGWVRTDPKVPFPPIYIQVLGFRNGHSPLLDGLYSQSSVCMCVYVYRYHLKVLEVYYLYNLL